MKRINMLDVDTSNKIAAGEVVERPASVVKELLENSIDAKSKNITIEILDGGQKTIKVIDDGSGIHPEDIEKAFLPHATSKIMTIDDINTISTLGFRGEALASISAVSNIMLKSRVEDYDYGMEISISGGRMNYFKETGCNVGTSIEVNDLFFYVPARQKFLKSAQRESAYISDLIEKLALCNSDVSFKYSSNGKKMITTFGNGKLIDAIRSIYGKEIQSNLNEFEKHSDIASVYGYIGSSEISKGSRNDQSIFVNKRFIKSKLITTAVEQAFKSFLTINKFPFFILFLDIFPELIDVNVHPTKSEIKFRDDREIFKLVFDSVHEALRKSLRQIFVSSDQRTEEVHQVPIDLKSDNSKVEQYRDSDNTYLIKEEASCFHPALEKRTEGERVSIDITRVEVKQENKLEENAKFSDLNVIGQFYGTYILAEGNDELYIIDQHAAHEKILFEKYTKQINRRELIAQVLASPVVMELNSEDFTYYVENIDIFKNTGFNIDIFGENTISIREVPIILGKPDLKNLFTDIIKNLKEMGSGEAAEVKYNKIASLACKSAVKAKDLLSYLEMKALIKDLRYIDDPFTCPHGRPTIIKMSVNELEKRFKRIQ